MTALFVLLLRRNVTLLSGHFSDLTVSARIDERRSADAVVPVDADGRGFFALQLDAPASGQILQLQALAQGGCVLWMRYQHVKGAFSCFLFLFTPPAVTPLAFLHDDEARPALCASASICSSSDTERSSRWLSHTSLTLSFLFLRCMSPFLHHFAGAALQANIVVAAPPSACVLPRRLPAAPSSASVSSLKEEQDQQQQQGELLGGVAAPAPITLASQLYARDPYLHALALRKARARLCPSASSLLLPLPSPHWCFSV